MSANTHSYRNIALDRTVVDECAAVFESLCGIDEATRRKTGVSQRHMVRYVLATLIEDYRRRNGMKPAD